MEINQACPNKASWWVWRKAMKIWTLTRKLTKHLRRWIILGDQLHCNWPAYYDYNMGHIYIKQCDNYVQYQQDKDGMHIFCNVIECNCSPTISSVPAYVVTTDVMVMWEDFKCHRIAGDIKVHQY
eukprot:8607337-Ditylum_brightwellii.AAC.1